MFSLKTNLLQYSPSSLKFFEQVRVLVDLGVNNIQSKQIGI